MGRGARNSGADTTIVIRFFAIGTTDDIAIKELIKSNVIDNDCISIKDEYGVPVELDTTDPSRLVKMSLLSDDKIRLEKFTVPFVGPSGLEDAIREYKLNGGVFYWDPDTQDVKVRVDKKWVSAGNYDIHIPKQVDVKDVKLPSKEEMNSFFNKIK
jgi:hypothetical protein